MSDSEVEDAQLHPQKRIKRFKFRTFAQRVEEVDVDVYRRVQPLRSQPLDGFSSFFQENLSKWRELNSAADWVQLAAQLTPLCHTMPMLLHHKERVLQLLVDCLRMTAHLSLPAVLALLGVLARDLQGEFRPLLPTAITAITELLATGAERDPDLLEHIFTCVSFMFKHMIRHLMADLPGVLKLTAAMRYSSAEHVRTLAAEAVGFLLRGAQPPALRVTVRCLLAEHASRPSWPRTHGAGLLLAEAASGVGNGLHSRAPALLALVLTEDLVRPEEFRSAAATGEGTGMTQEKLRALATAVAEVAVGRLLEHVRRGRAIDMWGALLSELNHRAAAAAAAAAADRLSADAAAARRSLARVLALAAQMVEFYRGSRVEDFKPLLEAVQKLASSPALTPAHTQGEAEAEQGGCELQDGGQLSTAPPADGEEFDARSRHLRPSLHQQVLRLMLAIVLSHGKVVGASQGLAVIARAAPAWAPVFSKAPAEDLLPFVRGLLHPPATPEALRIFAPPLLGALGQEVQAGREPLAGQALPVLLDVCRALQPKGSGRNNDAALPLIFMAQPDGTKLASHLCDLVAAASSGQALALSRRRTATLWGALQLMPYSCAQPAKALQLCMQVRDAAEDALRSTPGAPGAAKKDAQRSALGGEDADAAGPEDLQLLYAAAVEMLAEMMAHQQAGMLTQAAEGALALVLRFPSSYPLLKATGQLLSAAKAHAPAAGGLLSSQRLLALLPSMLPNLSSPSQRMRAASLALLCCFEQPPSTGASTKGTTPERSELLPVLLSINNEPCTIDAGRRWGVALARQRSALEYAHVPATLQPAMVAGLLGLLQMRFSPLWLPAAEGLAATLEYCPQVAWPVLLQSLQDTQAAFLSGRGASMVTGLPGGADADQDEGAEDSGQDMLARLASAQSSGSAAASGGHTDAANRLRHLLKALAKAPPGAVEKASRDWVPIMLAFCASKASLTGRDEDEGAGADEEGDDEGAQGDGGVVLEGDGVQQGEGEVVEDGVKRKRAVKTAKGAAGDASQGGTTAVGGKAWRGVVKEWLEVIGGIKGANALHRAKEVQQAVAGQLGDIDVAVQLAALHTLKAFRLKYLNEHMERLLRLADNKSLRNEMAAFPLSRGADGGIAEEQRPGLVPLIIRLLVPKMRKRSGRLGGKGASGSARSAVLNFLAALEPLELRPLLELLLAPLDSAFSTSIEGGDGRTGREGLVESVGSDDEVAAWDRGRLLPPPSWGRALGTRDGAWWLRNIHGDILQRQNTRLKLGLINTVEDLLAHLGYRLAPFLPALLAVVAHMLSSAAATVAAGSGTPFELDQAKELRTKCLRVCAQVWLRFPTSTDYAFLWPLFFAAAEPLMARLPTESSAPREPPLLECALALSSSPALVPVLANALSMHSTATHSAAPLASADEDWARRGLGGQLLGSCVAMLAYPTCSDVCRTGGLDVVSSLLGLEDAELTRAVVLPWAPQLLAALRVLLLGASLKPATAAGDKKSGAKAAAEKKAAARQRSSRRFGQELAILQQLVELVGDVEGGEQLADALMALLQGLWGGKRGVRGGVDEGSATAGLAALAAVWGRLADAGAEPTSRDQLERHSEVLAALGGRLSSRNALAALCDAYRALGRRLAPLAPAASILAELQAWSEDAIDEKDYERRLAGYAGLSLERWREVGAVGALPLLLVAHADLRKGDDLALRQGAAQAVTRFVDAAAEEGTEGGPLTKQLSRVVFPQVRSSLGASSLAVRQEHTGLLRHMVVKLPGRFPALAALASTDPETDFFLNVAHLQLHRRVRALRRLAAAAEPGTVGMLAEVALPILQQMVVEGTSDGAKAHDMKQGDVDRGANVVDSALTALGALAGQLPWRQYEQLLNRFLKLMQAKPTKAAVRSVCCILDAFHFPLPKDVAASKATAAAAAAEMAAEAAARRKAEEAEAAALLGPAGAPEDAEAPVQEGGKAPGTAVNEQEAEEGEDGEDEGDAEEGEEGEVGDEGAEARQEAAEQQSVVIQRALMKRILPALHRQLIQDKEVVRPPVAIALVKLLKLLPAEAERTELPRALHGISNLLRMRLQRIRDDARAVLATVAAELGPTYLPYVAGVLRASLGERGFAAHVVGYTLHSVLEAVTKKGIAPGSLDDAADPVLAIIEDDLFGQLAEAKEEAAFATKHKEAKRLVAYDTLLLLASGITFSTHMPVLLGPIGGRLHLASSPKIRNKLSQMLQFAARGLQRNPTSTAVEVALFIHSTLNDCLSREEAARERAKAAAVAATSQLPQALKPASEEDKAVLHEYLMVEFALNLMRWAVREGPLARRAQATLGLLDPLLPMLVRAISCRHAAAASLALKIMALMVALPLPGMAEAAPSAGRAVMALIKRAPSTSHPVAQDCLRLLGAMLRECSTYQPTLPQVRMLLRTSFADLEVAGEQQQQMFGMLRSILGRRLVMPEVYDVMENVQATLVKSHSAAVRAQCGSALLAFLLDYPLGPKRLAAHLSFLLTNLGYEHEDGRMAALNMLSQVVAKFPEAQLAERAELFFLPLVTRLVNDPVTRCRTAVAAATKTLLARLPAERQDRLAAYCLSWLGGQDGAMRRVAGQALGLLADAEGARFGRRLRDIVPLVAQVLEDQVEASRQVADDVGEQHDAEEPLGCPGWQEAYYCLLMLEKAATQSSAKLAWSEGPEVQRLWEGISHLLYHCHLWVRKAAARLVGRALADQSLSTGLLSSRPTAAGELAFRFYLQLEAGGDDEACLQATKCLVALAPHLPAGTPRVLAAAGGDQPPHAAAAANNAEDGSEIDVEAAAEEPVDADEGFDEDEDDEEAGPASDQLPGVVDGGVLSLLGLVRRMARLADDRVYGRMRQRLAALRWVAAAASRLGAAVIVPHLPLLMRPLQRISEPGAVKEPTEVSTLAAEVVSHLRDIVGTDAMLAAYNQARQLTLATRAQRKRHRVLQAMMDPEATAQRKRRRTAHKTAGRKRKVEEQRRSRSASTFTRANKRGGKKGQSSRE